MSAGIQIPIGGDLAPFIAAVQKIKGEVGGMERSVKSSLDATGRAAKGVGKDFRQIGADGHGAASKIKSAFSGLSNLMPGGSLTGKLSMMGGSSYAGMSSKAIMGSMGGLGGLGGMAAGATGVGAVAGGFAATLKGSMAILEGYAPYDSLVRGLKTLDGTAADTQARIELLRDVAKLPGLGFEEAVRGDIRLRSAGLSAKTSEAALRAFGNALATVGGGKEELDGVIMALTQISAKGKVSAEEINQLAERLPQIRGAMKAAFGTSDTEALQKMGISSQVFIEKIVQQFGKLPSVTGGARNAVENFGDSWKRLKNTSSEFFLSISSDVTGAFSSAMSRASDALDGLKKKFGVTTAGLGGKDGKTEAKKEAEKAAAAAAKAKSDSAAAAQNLKADNDAYWAGQKKQEMANNLERETTKLLKDQETAARVSADNAKRFAAAREAAFSATLTPRENIVRKMRDLEAQGPMGSEAINAAAEDATKAADIAERSAAFLTLKQQLKELDVPKETSFSAPQVLTTALGRIGGGGMGLTIMPMLAAQKESNGFLRQVADSTKKMAAKLTPAKAIV